MSMRTSNYIENLTDQLEGYAQEVARTVKNISNQYEVSPSLAMRIIEAAINDMMVDVKHHQNYQLELISNSLEMISEALHELSEE